MAAPGEKSGLATDDHTRVADVVMVGAVVPSCVNSRAIFFLTEVHNGSHPNDIFYCLVSWTDINSIRLFLTGVGHSATHRRGHVTSAFCGI